MLVLCLQASKLRVEFKKSINSLSSTSAPIKLWDGDGGDACSAPWGQSVKGNCGNAQIIALRGAPEDANGAATMRVKTPSKPIQSGGVLDLLLSVGSPNGQKMYLVHLENRGRGYFEEGEVVG